MQQTVSLIFLKISINEFSWGLEIEVVQLQVKYFHSWELSLWL